MAYNACLILQDNTATNAMADHDYLQRPSESIDEGDHDVDVLGLSGDQSFCVSDTQYMEQQPIQGTSEETQQVKVKTCTRPIHGKTAKLENVWEKQVQR